MAEEILRRIQEKFPKVSEAEEKVKPYVTLRVDKSELVDVARFMKEEGFLYLDMATAVDWKGPVDRRGFVADSHYNPFLSEDAAPEPRLPPSSPGGKYREAFEVIYLLSNFSKGLKLALRVEISRDEAGMPSLAPVFKSADWQEREIYDLMGIEFSGHPNLTKILTPDFIKGHPLRKDYVHKKDRYD